ncbi:MAG TPA: sigma-70 family RNA polymerase sigma factor [Phototrophicaceae bacterium]|nr:sigma-70 family RNA polymerase sigma factor [Phototrophicaceae bacterium]
MKSQQIQSRSASAPPDVEDEARLIQLAKQNPALFAPLYERYFDRVYAYCFRRTENSQEAEDLCSLVFTRALSGLHTYREGVFAAWLFGIAHNVVVDYYHKRRPLVSIEEVELPVDDDVTTIELADDGRILRELIDQLTDEQRDLLAMSLESDLSSQEIGDALGKSAGAVRVQLHRTFKQLRKHYLKLTGEQQHE